MSFGDFYNVLKDLVSLAKKSKDQKMLDLATDLQAHFFDLREENENLKEENKRLNEKIKLLECPNIKEEDIEYSSRGFLTIKNETPVIPYCSFCWKKEHKLYPLTQCRNYYEFKCASCNSIIIVLDDDGHQIIRKNI